MDLRGAVSLEPLGDPETLRNDVFCQIDGAVHSDRRRESAERGLVLRLLEQRLLELIVS